jgi:hypothetical protein
MWIMICRDLEFSDGLPLPGAQRSRQFKTIDGLCSTKVGGFKGKLWKRHSCSVHIRHQQINMGRGSGYCCCGPAPGINTENRRVRQASTTRLALSRNKVNTSSFFLKLLSNLQPQPSSYINLQQPPPSQQLMVLGHSIVIDYFHFP